MKSRDKERGISLLEPIKRRAITLSAMIIFLLLLMHSIDSQAARYRCQPTFGETVPLGLALLKKESEFGREYGQKLPGTTVWNSGVENPGAQTSKAKRRLVKSEEGFFYLDTRYMIQKAKPFLLELTCSKEKKPCDLRLLEGERIQFSTLQPLFDQRDPTCKGEVSVQTTRRGVAGVLARLWKRCGDSSKTLSGSGEIKLFQENKEFSFDFGIDEQLQLGKNTFERIAALELKVECEALESVK